MDWWFDIDGKICRVSVDLRAFKKPSVTFGGETGGAFVERKDFKNGSTYVYAAEGEHLISINIVRLRGERYVSLYVDRTLIQEYNSGEQKYRRLYYARSAQYDSDKKFLASGALTAPLCAVPVSAAVTALAAFFNLVSNVSAAAAFAGIVFLLASAALFAVSAAFYAYSKGRMARYAIISSIKRAKRIRAARKKAKRKSRFF